MFEAVRGNVPVNARVTVNIYAAILPATLPTDIVDEEGALNPANAAFTPASGTKPRAQRNAEAEHDGSAYKEPGRGGANTISGS